MAASGSRSRFAVRSLQAASENANVNFVTQFCFDTQFSMVYAACDTQFSMVRARGRAWRFAFVPPNLNGVTTVHKIVGRELGWLRRQSTTQGIPSGPKRLLGVKQQTKQY